MTAPGLKRRSHWAISLAVLDFVSPALVQALREASKALTSCGVRHALCGGFAVGAYGYVRATRDVDFLAGDEAFVTQGSLVTFAPGVPFAVGSIPTDMVPLGEDLRFMEEELEAPYDFTGIPIVSPEGLVAMKLVPFRRRDQEDIEGLIETGATSWTKCGVYLQRHQRREELTKLRRLAAEGL
jgi:hypothetical protein